MAPNRGKPRRKAIRNDFPFRKEPSGDGGKQVDQWAFYFENVTDSSGGSRSFVQWLDQKDDLIAVRAQGYRDKNLRLKGPCDLNLTQQADLLA